MFTLYSNFGGSLYLFWDIPWYSCKFASECPDVKNYKWWLNPIWHKMLYSCTHIATASIKGLMLASLFDCWYCCHPSVM